MNLTKKRDEKLIPIARKLLLAIVAREDLVMGGSETISIEKAAKYYQDKYIDIVIPLLLENDIKIIDIDYLFQLMLQPINLIKEITMSSFDSNRKISDAQMYGLKDIDDLKISDLDKYLKKFAKSKK